MFMTSPVITGLSSQNWDTEYTLTLENMNGVAHCEDYVYESFNATCEAAWELAYKISPENARVLLADKHIDRCHAAFRLELARVVEADDAALAEYEAAELQHVANLVAWADMQRD